NLVAHAVKDPVQVDVDNLVPAFQGQFARGGVVTANTGVVEGQVQGAKLCFGKRHRRACVVGVGGVADMGAGLASGICYFLGNAFGGVSLDVRHNHACTPGGEQFGGFFANARASTTYQRNLSLKIGHVRTPSSRDK